MGHHEHRQPQVSAAGSGSARRTRLRRSGRGPRSARRETPSRDRAPARAPAPTRLIMPPDSSAGKLVGHPRAPARPFRAWRSRSRPSAAATDGDFRAPGTGCSAARVSDENSAPCWNRMPHRRRRAGCCAPGCAPIDRSRSPRSPASLRDQPDDGPQSTPSCRAPEAPTKPENLAPVDIER